MEETACTPAMPSRAGRVSRPPAVSHHARIGRLIRRAIAAFELDLRGEIILTEAATGYYALTPIIAALAGAEKVLLLSRDSRFARAGDAIDGVFALAENFGVARRITALSNRAEPLVGEASLVTNLGPVRPIDAALLQRLAAGAVVSLMWETWEFRADDVDRAACERLGIPLLGTDEHHPALDIFNYLGDVALKLLLNADIEIHKSAVVVAGSGEFAAIVVRDLTALGAKVAFVDTTKANALASASEMLREADALVIVEHHNRGPIIGEGGVLARDIAQLNKGLVVAHIAGNVDQHSLTAAQIATVPAHFAPPGYMSVATDHAGPRPLIDLHAAGLAVGQAMRQATRKGARGLAAERAALESCPFAQGFADRHQSVKRK